MVETRANQRRGGGIGRSMESASDDLHRLSMGTRLSHEHIVELALSGEVTVMWRYDFADSAITWMAGADELLGVTPPVATALGRWGSGGVRPAVSPPRRAQF